MKSCKHERTMRGPDEQRRYGSWQTHVCVACGMWRTTDHRLKQPGPWRPFAELDAATTWTDDD